jgi:hypothetical protein
MMINLVLWIYGILMVGAAVVWIGGVLARARSWRGRAEQDQALMDQTPRGWLFDQFAAPDPQDPYEEWTEYDLPVHSATDVMHQMGLTIGDTAEPVNPLSPGPGHRRR